MSSLSCYTTCSLLLVSLGSALLAVTGILWHGLKIFKNIFSILNTAMSFLLSLKNAESSSFMTDSFFQNFLPMLTRHSSSSFTISAGKEKEKTKFLNIPNITLLIPILYITVSFLSFILLAETWNGTLIFMPLFHQEDSIKILSSRKWDTSMLTLLPSNENTMSLKLLKTAAIPTRRLRKPLKILSRSFTRKTKGFSLMLAAIRRSLSFLTIWLIIKRKPTLLCLLRDLFPIF